METITEQIVTARKVHICGAGYGKIMPGEKYKRQVNKDGGDIWTWKSCMKCEDAMKKPENDCSDPCDSTWPDGWAYELGVGCAEHQPT